MKKTKIPLIAAWLIIIIPFILARLSYYICFNIPGIGSDSIGYITPVLEVLHGIFPHFDFRNPGYPLFILICEGFGLGIHGIMVIQGLIILVAALFLVQELYFSFTSHIILFAIALSAFLISNQQLTYETSMLSDSLFTAFVLLFLAQLLYASRKRSFVASMLLGLILWMTIMIRPAGISLLPLYLFWMIYLWKSGFPYKRMLGSALVFIILLIAVFVYNYSTTQHFGLAKALSTNRFGATLTYQEPWDHNPDVLNREVVKYQGRLNEHDLQILRESYDIRSVMKIYTEEYEKMWPIILEVFHEMELSEDTDDGRYSSVFPYLDRASHHAILTHPQQFFRLYAMSFSLTLIRNRCSWEPAFPDILLHRYDVLCQQDLAWMMDTCSPEYGYVSGTIQASCANAEGRIQLNPSHKINPGQGHVSSTHGITYATDLPRPIQWYYAIQIFITSLLFFNFGYFWSLITMAVLGISLYRWIFTHHRAFPDLLILALSFTYFIYIALITMMVYPLERLSYPMEFLKYFSLVFLIYLLKKIRCIPQKVN